MCKRKVRVAYIYDHLYSTPQPVARRHCAAASVTQSVLRVGCPQDDDVTSYPYLMHYDIEVSGFGSHQSGHLCLLRLTQQIYPGGELLVNHARLIFTYIGEHFQCAHSLLVNHARRGYDIATLYPISARL